MPTLAEKEERAGYQQVIREKALEGKLIEVSAKITAKPPYPKMKKAEIERMAEKLVALGQDYKPPEIAFKARRMSQDDIAWIFESLGVLAVTGKAPSHTEAPSLGVYGYLMSIVADPQLKQKFYLECMDLVKPSNKDLAINDRYNDPNKSIATLLESLGATKGSSPVLPPTH